MACTGLSLCIPASDCKSLSKPQPVSEQADFVPTCLQVKALEAAEAARRKEAARAADKAKQKAEKARRADAAKVSCRRQWEWLL